VIDINALDYEWQLIEAKKKLQKYVQNFKLSDIGLTNDLMVDFCPEAEPELVDCVQEQATLKTSQFHEEAVSYIDLIFPRGTDDMIIYLGENFHK
jgi:hypothetical protein